MKTLSEYLKENFERKVVDHSIRSNVDSKGVVTFYIHADGVDSDTLDFVVSGNVLRPKEEGAWSGPLGKTVPKIDPTGKEG